MPLLQQPHACSRMLVSCLAVTLPITTLLSLRVCAYRSHESDLLYFCGAEGVKTVHLRFLTLTQ